MRNNNRLIITARCKQGITQMKRNTAHGIAMQTHCLIWFGGQIQIEPQHFLVICGNQQIITFGMYGHARNPFGIGKQFLDKLLLDQIINAYVVLSLQSWEKCSTIRIVLEKNKNIGLSENSTQILHFKKYRYRT